MNRHLVAIVSCSWLAAAAAAAPPAPAGPPPAATPPQAAAPSPARESLEALWGSKLLHAVVIADVAAGSPAEKAGLKIGDVLESYDRVGVDAFPDVQEFAAGLKAAARKGPVAVKVRRFEGDAGPPQTLGLELRLPVEPETRVGLAIHPGVFFLDMKEAGAAAKTGVRPWDCIDSVEDESLSDRSRMSDFEAHVLTLRNKEGGVRVEVGRWRPAPRGSDPKIVLDGAREVVLPLPAR